MAGPIDEALRRRPAHVEPADIDRAAPVEHAAARRNRRGCANRSCSPAPSRSRRRRAACPRARSRPRSGAATSGRPSTRTTSRPPAPSAGSASAKARTSRAGRRLRVHDRSFRRRCGQLRLKHGRERQRLREETRRSLRRAWRACGLRNSAAGPVHRPGGSDLAWRHEDRRITIASAAAAISTGNA